ncbi:hypothetical protein SAMN06264365_101547 [Actinoplanes regularis]|uniref:Uncharacterized protein n=1 Tax=Actinoplanes regularis TaxID=52697 RepID=A0A238V2V0_9ACTN|nr:hypothetical protein SAMN06264365_101547 [Actinoplanes regularis]
MKTPTCVADVNQGVLPAYGNGILTAEGHQTRQPPRVKRTPRKNAARPTDAKAAIGRER